MHMMKNHHTIVHRVFYNHVAGEKASQNKDNLTKQETIWLCDEEQTKRVEYDSLDCKDSKSIQAFRNLSNVFKESFDSLFAAVLASLLKCTCLLKNASQIQCDTVTGFFVLWVTWCHCAPGECNSDWWLYQTQAIVPLGPTASVGYICVLMIMHSMHKGF